VDDAGTAFGLGPADRYQFVVAVNEAATNAIKHGQPYSDGAIVLSIDGRGDRLVCSISDGGRFVRAPAEPGALAEGGRGLKLMARLTDGTNISTGVNGTTVRLHKRRSPAPNGSR